MLKKNGKGNAKSWVWGWQIKWLGQQPGHDTDSYVCLRHEIQDLIDSYKIPDPEREHPNTHTNPLPNYHSVPPPTYMIDSGLPENFVLQTFNHQASYMETGDDSEEP